MEPTLRDGTAGRGVAPPIAATHRWDSDAW
jgi:hypothetical protein